MPIQIYNSLTRKKEEFDPPRKQVKMYVCGPTVYDEPHIGHARSAYIFDLIRRYLLCRGYRVKFVRNVTDVDDKIIERAKKEYQGEGLNISVDKVAAKYLAAYHQALDKLGITSSGPDILEPKASEYIGKMVEFIQELIGRGTAYPAGGDVYFDITKARNYGKLSNQSLDKMEVGARVTPEENKKNPLDFALWKAAKADEPCWDSPWGKGRPGWHIECSVMSSDLLGDEFDIHGGGIDLIFPHHENEIAQSEGAGKKFARAWLHHGLLTINGQKMAKSLGNFVTVDDFLVKYRNPDFLKLLFLSTHYSHPVDYTDEKMEEAKKAYERILILMDKIAKSIHGSQTIVHSKKSKEIEEIKNRFIRAMDDDFNTPQALAAIFDLVTAANKNIDDAGFLGESRKTLKDLLDIFGITLSAGAVSADDKIKDKEVDNLIKERIKARQDKNFVLADKIRKELEEKGIILEDTKKGKTTWRRKL